MSKPDIKIKVRFVERWWAAAATMTVAGGWEEIGDTFEDRWTFIGKSVRYTNFLLHLLALSLEGGKVMMMLDATTPLKLPNQPPIPIIGLIKTGDELMIEDESGKERVCYLRKTEREFIVKYAVLADVAQALGAAYRV